METNNKTRNIIIGIACLLVIILIGYVIFQRRQIRQISQLANPETDAQSESYVSVPNEAVPDNIPASSGRAAGGTGEIQELEYQLNAAEEELDAAHRQLADEATQKAENAKNMIDLQKKMFQDPAYKEMIRNTYKGQLDTIYGSLYTKLNLSPEKLDQLKELLTDQLMSAAELSMDMLGSTPSEEKRAELQRQSEDLKKEYDAKVSELLGGQDFKTYEAYKETLAERQTVEMFTASLNEDEKLTDTQKDSLIDSMYKERENLYSQQGWDEERVTFSSEYNDEGISKMMDMVDSTYDGYLKGAGTTLSASQLEQFKTYLKNQRDMTESALKMSAQMFGGQSTD